MKKCPLKNFKKCDTDCAWYLEKAECCSVHKLTNLKYIETLDELKPIGRNIESISQMLNNRS